MASGEGSCWCCSSGKATGVASGEATVVASGEAAGDAVSQPVPQGTTSPDSESDDGTIPSLLSPLLWFLQDRCDP